MNRQILQTGGAIPLIETLSPFQTNTPPYGGFLGDMKTKLAKIKEALANGNDIEALRIASKFPQLGEHKEAITRGWAAYTNSAFYKQLGKDPIVLFRQGIEAIRQRYNIKEKTDGNTGKEKKEKGN